MHFTSLHALPMFALSIRSVCVLLLFNHISLLPFHSANSSSQPPTPSPTPLSYVYYYCSQFSDLTLIQGVAFTAVVRRRNPQPT